MSGASGPSGRPWPSWKVLYAGICGTDRLLAKQSLRPGFILGHEVVCAGREGGCYVLNNELPCGQCPYCLEGQFSHCDQLLELGVNAHGGFGRELRAPAASLYRIRLRDPRIGILVEPLACALHGAERLGRHLAGYRVPPRILLVGAGVAGRLLALALRQVVPEAELSVHDPDAQAMRWGPPTGVAALAQVPEAAFHAAVECSGTAGGGRTALRAVRRAGAVLLYGIPPAGSRLPLTLGVFFERELTLVASRAGCDPDTFARAVALVEAHAEALGPLLGRTVGLRDLQEELLQGRPLPGTRTLLDPSRP